MWTQQQTGQVDTGFTLIEVVKPSEFAKHAPVGSSDAPLTREEAMAPLVAADPREDARHGRLFVVLDAPETLAHYAPRLDALRPFVAAGGAPLRTLLVNGRYLALLPPEQAALARAVLVVDTKGLERSAAQEIFEGARPGAESVARFVDAAALRALVLRMAAMPLFLVPAAQCRVAGPQISEFELAALMASDSAHSVADSAAELKRVLQCAGAQAGSTSTSSGSSGGGGGDNSSSGGGFWKLVKPMLGAWACAVDVARAATDFIGWVRGGGGNGGAAGAGAGAAGAAGGGGAGAVDAGAAARAALGGAGNSRWGSTRFVFTKMDEVVWTPAEERAFWYDVGRVLALSCHFIETPPPAHCLRVALPGPQQGRHAAAAAAAPVTGDLAQLTRRTVVAAAQNLWEEQLDRTIAAAAADLRARVCAEASALTRRATLLRIDEIAQRAECRLQDAVAVRLASAAGAPVSSSSLSSDLASS